VQGDLFQLPTNNKQSQNSRMIKFSALVIFVLAMALTANGGETFFSNIWCGHYWKSYIIENVANLGTTPMRVPENGVIFPNGKGCSCYGIEWIGTGGGPRYFHIHCNYLNRDLECQYRGNPHKYKAYNKNQRGYYSELLLMISKKVCHLPFGNCPERSRGYFPEKFPDDQTANFFFHAKI